MLLYTSGDSGIIRQIKKSHSIQKLYDDVSFKRQVNIIVYLMSVLFCRGKMILQQKCQIYLLLFPAFKSLNLLRNFSVFVFQSWRKLYDHDDSNMFP